MEVIESAKTEKGKKKKDYDPELEAEQALEEVSTCLEKMLILGSRN